MRTAALIALLATMAAAGDPPPADGGVNAFACDLYRALEPGKQNLFFSPYSVAVAMAMTREGAKGETAREMDAVLHLDGDFVPPESLRPKPVWDHGGRKPKQVPAYELSIANALWGQKGLTFEKAFLSRLLQKYGAPLERIDFRESDKARETINDWVATQTKDRIKDIVPPPLPSPDTLLALANAIHFKAAWAEPFDKRWTKSKAFFVPKIKLAVPMMHRTDEFRYAETEDAQILELPYRGGQTSMVVLLPKKVLGIWDLEKQLTGPQLTRWLASMKSRPVTVRFPKFEVTCPVNLTETLPAMGMKRAFDRDRADFTGMTTEKPLFVGAVLHLSLIHI